MDTNENTKVDALHVKSDAEIMAELEAEEAVAKEKAAAEALAAEDAKKTAEAGADIEDLVEMMKDGLKLHVHPNTVQAHVEAGWQLV